MTEFNDTDKHSLAININKQVILLIFRGFFWRGVGEGCKSGFKTCVPQVKTSDREVRRTPGKGVKV